MPSLCLIESEAQRLVGRLPEEQRRTLEAALIERCEIHWRKLRAALLRGTLAPPFLHHHDHRTALWKALVIMAQTLSASICLPCCRPSAC